MEMTLDELYKHKIINTWAYYDMPLIFFAQSPEKKYYFSYFAEEMGERGEIGDRWMFAEVTEEEKNSVNNKEIGFLELLENLKKQERLYYMTLIHPNEALEQKESLTLTLVTNVNFDPEDFPESNFFAEYDYSKRDENSPEM